MERSIYLIRAVLTLVTICGVSCQFENTIYIDSKNGNDNVSCLITEALPCATLEYAIENGLFNSTQFVFLDEIVTLNSTLSINNSDSISFTSGNVSYPSVLSCTIQNETTGAGLFFNQVTNLLISRLSFNHCGNILDSTTRDEDTMLKFRSAVYVLNSTNVTIEHVNFANNPGVGLVLFDTNGFVSIHHSSFINNYVPLEEQRSYAGGGGLYIEHTYCTPGKLSCVYEDNPYSNDSYYSIFNCFFGQNRATILPERGITWVRFEKSSSNRLGRGAGVAITVKGESTNNLFQIKNCTFVDNSAEFGGALNIQLQDYSMSNVLEVSDTTFTNNTSLNGGGGALFLGIFFYDCDCVFDNEIKLTNVDFVENRALYGGAIIFSSSRSKLQDRNNQVSFLANTWTGNIASLGAAVLLSQEAWNAHALSSGYLPSPVFEDCVFEENKIEQTDTTDNDGLTYQTTEGVLFSSSYSINFTSSAFFSNNQGTAISITAGFVNILENATATFTGNHGNRGGALALLEFASLRTFPGSVLNFTNNSATSAGGAIYASSSDDTDFYYSRSCFIVYSDDTKPDPRNWTTDFFFSGNKAGPCSVNNQERTECHDNAISHYGNSIFAISIAACDRATEGPGRNITPGYYFKQEPPFHFLTGMYVSTDPSNIFVDPDILDSNTLKLSPGEDKNLSLSAIDDMGNNVRPVYTASVTNKANKDVEVDSSSLYVSANTVKLTGEVGAEFQLNLRTVARRIVSLSINASLTNCPPGLVYSQVSKKCVCSATLPNQWYNGITKCSTESFNAFLDRGYWAGCSGENDSILLTAECPFGYCRYSDAREINNVSINDPIRSTFFVLPNTCDELDTFLCGDQNREGNLCGQCKANFSVFYHSHRSSCHECDSNVGIIFYLLSEILPITILFIIIVGFNVHLTSGLWSSAILFGQIIDFFEVHSSDLKEQSQGLAILTNIYRFVYSAFNLDFFKYDDNLSFCLFKGASIMHVLIFKYISTVYTILLLVVLVYSFRSSCCNRCHGFWTKLEHIFSSGTAQTHSWVIHGIAAFLVLSYAQCAKVSFQILSWTDLQRERGVSVKKVPLLSGELDYFKGEHAIYAVIALIVIIAVTILPLFLLLYPIYYRVLSHCLGEHRYEKFSTTKCFDIIDMPFVKLKPLLDAFQGCYKTKFRFFAGLFFLYRFAVAACYAFSTNVTMLTVLLEIIIILMLGLHTLSQPYENRFFNVVDSLMLTNLAIVNVLNLFSGNLPALRLQVFLIYLSLIYIFVMAIVVTITRFSTKARKYLKKPNEYIPLFELPAAESYDDLSDHHSISSNNNAPDDDIPYRIYEEDHQRELEKSELMKSAAEQHKKQVYCSFEGGASPNVNSANP